MALRRHNGCVPACGAHARSRLLRRSATPTVIVESSSPSSRQPVCDHSSHPNPTPKLSSPAVSARSLTPKSSSSRRDPEPLSSTAASVAFSSNTSSPPSDLGPTALATIPIHPSSLSRHQARKISHLPDDVLWRLIHILVQPTMSATSPTTNAATADGRPATTPWVDHAGYARGLKLAMTNRTLANHFFASLEAIALPSVATLTDNSVSFIARKTASGLKHLVVRNCPMLTDISVLAMADHMTALRSVDLSFLSNITDGAVLRLCTALGPQLEKLLLRRCINISDKSLYAVASCSNLHTLDLSHVGDGITDLGILLMCRGCGPSIRFLSISHNARLTDNAFTAIGTYCTALEQLCARNLPLVTDLGFNALCLGVGASAHGLDVIDCRSLTKRGVVQSLRMHCVHIHLIDPENHSLRSIIVSTLRHNIFIIKGADPGNGMHTVHTCVVDNGDIASACILMAGTTDLSLVSLVLAKSYGSTLDEETVGMLSSSYGLPAELLA